MLAESPFKYRAFDLNISSEIEFADLRRGCGEPDVHVRLGRVPERLENATVAGVFYQAAPRQLLMHVESVGRFVVTGGNRITVDAAPGADTEMLSLLLAGPAFGALLQQRRVLTLHGSAIRTVDGAVVFAGSSGSGKSTIAAAFHRRGYPVLADEICPVDTNGTLRVLPANPFLMLWADAAQVLGLNEALLRRARSALRKYILPLGDAFAAEPVPLRAVYVLEPSNERKPALLRSHGLAKIRLLNTALYRPHFAEGMGVGRQHSRQVAEVARQTKVVLVKRPGATFHLEELVDLVAADFTE